MENSAKVQIYRGMIQYLLDTTHYNLKKIAVLSNSSIRNIRSIYSYDFLPAEFSEELNLMNLYQVVIEQERRKHVKKNIVYQWN